MAKTNIFGVGIDIKGSLTHLGGGAFVAGAYYLTAKAGGCPVPHYNAWLGAVSIGAYGMLRELTLDWKAGVPGHIQRFYRDNTLPWMHFLVQNLVYPFIGWADKWRPDRMNPSKWTEGATWFIGAAAVAGVTSWVN